MTTPLSNLDLCAGSCCAGLRGACVSPSWLYVTLSALYDASSLCLSTSIQSILGFEEDPPAKTLSAPLQQLTIEILPTVALLQKIELLNSL